MTFSFAGLGLVSVPRTGDSAKMKAASVALCVLIALEHTFFLVLEMFLWTNQSG